MPFAKHPCDVSLVFKTFGNGDFIGVDVFLVGGADHPAAESGTCRISSCEQAVAGCGACWGGTIELWEIEPFMHHFRDVGRVDSWATRVSAYPESSTKMIMMFGLSNAGRAWSVDAPSVNPKMRGMSRFFMDRFIYGRDAESLKKRGL